jgi:antitoxin (DNA-binding transcriptional repressor) of toxin-antitoxin stability system
MSRIDVAEAKRDLDQLLERASQGEEVITTAVVDLRPDQVRPAEEGKVACATEER